MYIVQVCSTCRQSGAQHGTIIYIKHIHSEVTHGSLYARSQLNNKNNNQMNGTLSSLSHFIVTWFTCESFACILSETLTLITTLRATLWTNIWIFGEIITKLLVLCCSRLPNRCCFFFFSRKQSKISHKKRQARQITNEISSVCTQNEND